MISLIETPKSPVSSSSHKSEITANNADDKDEDMKDAPPPPPPVPAPPVPMTAGSEPKGGQELLISKTSTASKEELLDQQQQPKKASLPNLKKLGDEDCSTLLHACVGLMGLPVDAYALNAILRLLLRLTRTFDYAVIFAQMGGVKMLLDLTQASSFSGFFSLVSIFIIIFFLSSLSKYTWYVPNIIILSNFF